MQYTPEFCREMIRHYQAQASNWTKPATWHAHARMSVATWQRKLEQAESA